MKLNKQERRTSYELKLLDFAQEMKPTDPPDPWKHCVIIAAAGVIAGGWDINENIVLISGSGFSINHPITGVQIHRDRDSEKTYAHILNNGLTFKLPTFNEEIDIFGFKAGDGIHMTDDGWNLEVIYPWWPRASVIIDHVFSKSYNYLKTAVMINVPRLDGRLKCGFSPSGSYFVILGSGGAIVYSRDR